VNLGLVYYAQAKFDKSERSLAAAAKIRPGMRGVSLWLGIDDVRLHRPAQATLLLREAVRQDPTDRLAQSWLGTALWDAGQMDAALLQLGKATALFPDDPDLLFARGEAYGKAAARQTEQLLEASSGTALSDVIYGTHYAEERDWTKAEGHLRRATERDPRLVEAHLELAKVFVEKADLGAAQEQLEQTIELAPRSAAALALSGEVLLLMRRKREGMARIEMAVTIDHSEALNALKLPQQDEFSPGTATAELLPLCRDATEEIEALSPDSNGKETALAALFALAGNEDAALQAYRKIDPARASAVPPANILGLAMTAIHQHRYDDAEPLLLRWLATHSDDQLARYELILVRRSIFLSQMARLITVAPDSYHVHQLLGELYVSREEDDKALTEYLAVASARPDLAGVHFWLGHLYWKHGDADHAIAELTRELELSPGYPEAEAELGTVLVAEERAAEAIPHLESSIHSKADLWPAYAQLGRAYAIEKNYTGAEETLRRGLIHDQDASTHYQLALVLRTEGKTAQAAQVFAQVRAIKMEKLTAPSADDEPIQGPKQQGANE
jgi:tetratricopeptide (TPR) repeat protein